MKKFIKFLLFSLCIGSLGLYAAKKQGFVKKPGAAGFKKAGKKKGGRGKKVGKKRMVAPTTTTVIDKSKIGPGKAGNAALRTGKITKKVRFSQLSQGEQAYWRAYRNVHRKNTKSSR